MRHLVAGALVLVLLGWLPAPAAAEGCRDDLVAGAPPAITVPAQASVPDVTELAGTWVASQLPSNGSGLHCHTLTIAEARGPDAFLATVRTTAPMGWSVQVCDGRIADGMIAVNCDVTSGNTPYNADNFSLMLDGGRLVGINVDDGGATGDVVFCRMN